MQPNNPRKHREVAATAERTIQLSSRPETEPKAGVFALGGSSERSEGGWLDVLPPIGKT